MKKYFLILSMGLVATSLSGWGMDETKTQPAKDLTKKHVSPIVNSIINKIEAFKNLVQNNQDLESEAAKTQIEEGINLIEQAINGVTDLKALHEISKVKVEAIQTLKTILQARAEDMSLGPIELLSEKRKEIWKKLIEILPEMLAAEILGEINEKSFLWKEEELVNLIVAKIDNSEAALSFFERVQSNSPLWKREDTKNKSMVSPLKYQNIFLNFISKLNKKHTEQLWTEVANNCFVERRNFEYQAALEAGLGGKR